MATTVLNTTWTILCSGPNDANFTMTIEIDRVNSALANLSDYAIVDFVRDKLAEITALPVTIEKIDTIRTTESV